MKAKVFVILSLIFSSLFSETLPSKDPNTTPIDIVHEDQFVSDAPVPSYENSLIKMILTLVGLLLLVFSTLWILRKISHGRMGGFGGQKKIKIIEKRPLSPKTVIYLLELDGKEVFVAESQLEVKTLSTSYEIDPELD